MLGCRRQDLFLPPLLFFLSFLSFVRSLHRTFHCVVERTRTMRSCAQILAVAASAMLAAGVRAQGPVVNTKYGPVQGTTNGDVDVWHSIPFAAPPVGNLRFRPPAPPTPWTEVKDVSGLPNICPQLKIEGGLLFGNEVRRVVRTRRDARMRPARRASGPRSAGAGNAGGPQGPILCIKRALRRGVLRAPVGLARGG